MRRFMVDDLNELENQLNEFEKAFELSTQTIIKGSKKNSKAIVRKQTSSLVVNNITSTSTLPVSQTTRVISKPITKTLSNEPPAKIQKKTSKSKKRLDDDDDDEESDGISVYSDDKDSDDFLEDDSDEGVDSKPKKIIKAIKAKPTTTTRQPLAEKSLDNIVKSKPTVVKKVDNKQSNLAQETMSLLERIRAKSSVPKDTSSNFVDLSSDIEDNIYIHNKSSNKPAKLIKQNNLKNVKSKSQPDDLVDSDESENESNDSFSDVSSDESYQSDSKSKLKKSKINTSKAIKTLNKPLKAKTTVKPPSKVIDKLAEKGTKRPKKNNSFTNADVEVYTPDIPTPQPVKKQRKTQNVIPSNKSKVKKVINSDSESEEDDIYSESDGELVKASNKPLRNRKPTNYAIYYDNDSENDDEDD
eukprot:CAMPEP_0196768646 /NCGR_PEP_ID=MMETSP1095-20130614/43069_1 /TAXON_ID=96789 ORGANISM="Chromulina nebulosa, Strain UTEXLB2642" /NCGR_SAMPLE_ID=MMETSP1095 /ASSEMBLY_ACC=CAM_ASM_000446 /LENGTH=413 /DNA_ID=CAMNT_0042138657 /DNA_START=638 /DNA_END=1880 /DNA_ORIENTATION=-